MKVTSLKRPNPTKNAYGAAAVFVTDPGLFFEDVKKFWTRPGDNNPAISKIVGPISYYEQIASSGPKAVLDVPFTALLPELVPAA